MKKITIFIIFFLFSIMLKAYYPLKIETRLQSPQLKYLNADLYTRDTNLPKPVILVQTPYNKNLYHIWENGSASTPIVFDTMSYNYVIMDWRGFFSNKLADTSGYNRGFDGYDAVEWIAKQKWCNGKVGTWGGSALGLIQFLTARENPPHLVCAAPSIKDYKTKYEDYFYGGAFRKEQVQAHINLGFINNADLILSHPSKDLWWEAIEKLNDYPDKFTIPMLIATGWFDHYPGFVIRAFEDIQNRSNKTVRDQHKCIVGPWSHTKMGDLKQGVWEFPNAEHEDDKLTKLFFDYYLTNAKNGYPLKPKFTFYEMGSNQWLYEDNWSGITRSYDTLYLRSEGRLLDTPPPPLMGAMIQPPDTIIYDPRDPSPSFGGARFNPFDFSLKVGPQDISSVVESRNDVKLYTSEFNSKGKRIDGSVKIYLYVSSNRKDTDFGVRLTEVMPDGQSIILTQGIKRMRFRESLIDEKLMEKDCIYLVEIELEPLAIQLNQTSRLRIVVSSSNYNMFDVNPNNGGKLYEPGDSLVANNLIYRTSDKASFVLIPFIDKATGINEQSDKYDEVVIFPNPVNEVLYINSAKKFNKYEIYNLLGANVMAGSLDNDINVSQLMPGMYFIRLKSNTTAGVKMISFYIVR